MSPEMLVYGGLALFVLFLLSIIMGSLYRKCGPNQAMIISGFGAGEQGRNFKIVVGGGDMVLPVVQQAEFLSLEVLPIEIKAPSPIVTKRGVPILVDGVAQVKVKSDDVSVATAAERFLGKEVEEIGAIAHETLVGHLRAILGTMEVEELIQNIEEFVKRVQQLSLPDLQKMGLTIDSFTIKEIRDQQGYLESLGRAEIEEKKRIATAAAAEKQSSAQIAQQQATAEAQIRTTQAQAEAQVKQAELNEVAQKAKLAAETRVAEAAKNKEVSLAQYQAEVAKQKAASDVAYDIVKAQQQQKLVEETQKIKIVEAQKQVELEMVQVQRRQVELEAEITKPAEAEQSRVRLLAQAEQQKRALLAQGDAEATKLKAQGEAEATKLKAQADAEATKAIGQAEAEAQRARGLAEASVIAAKGEAEAEAMAKKAEAYKLYNDAAMASMVIDRLPEIVGAAASPLTRIGQMTVLATGGESAGASRITSDIMNVAAQGLTMVKGLTGIDLAKTLARDTKAIDDGTTD